MKRIAVILFLFLISGLVVAQPNASLQGRTVLGSLPRPSNTGKNSGVVVVNIWVDQYGTVQKAVAGAEGTTVTDNELWDSARKAALGTHFNMSADAPSLQHGTITYMFSIDKKPKERDQLISILEENPSIVDFAKLIKWDSSKAQFRKDFQTIVADDPQTQDDPFVIVHGIALGDYELFGGVFFDESGIAMISLTPPRTAVSGSCTIEQANLYWDELVPVLGEPEETSSNNDVTTLLDSKHTILGEVKLWFIGGSKIMAIYSKGNDEAYFKVLLIRNEAFSSPDSPDFREGYWGDDYATIKLKEGKRDEHLKDDTYNFQTKLDGKPCSVTYFFKKNKLVGGKYLITETKSKNAIESYQRFVSLLTRKYKEPSYDEIEYFDEKDKKSLLSIDTLFDRERIKFSSGWNLGRTIILVTLEKEDYTSYLHIEYLEYNYWKNKEFDADVLEDL